MTVTKQQFSDASWGRVTRKAKKFPDGSTLLELDQQYGFVCGDDVGFVYMEKNLHVLFSFLRYHGLITCTWAEFVSIPPVEDNVNNFLSIDIFDDVDRLLAKWQQECKSQNNKNLELKVRHCRTVLSNTLKDEKSDGYYSSFNMARDD